MAKPFVGGKIECIIIATVVSKFSHQDEHGDDGQAVIGEDIPHIRADHPKGCFEAGDITKSQEPDQCHRKAHRDPEQEEDKEHEKNPINPDDRSFHFVYSSLL